MYMYSTMDGGLLVRKLLNQIGPGGLIVKGLFPDGDLPVPAETLAETLTMRKDR